VFGEGSVWERVDKQQLGAGKTTFVTRKIIWQVEINYKKSAVLLQIAQRYVRLEVVCLEVELTGTMALCVSGHQHTYE
jgi:hypothetical protein